MSENNRLLNTSADPFELFNSWYSEASKSELNDPNAMNLSSISDDLKPSSRMVLLKNFNQNGFVFYTNIHSKKGSSINSNPHVALNFHWKTLLRQIRIEGLIKQVSTDEADEYFDSRPAESKIGAWASKQSSELLNRNDLKENILFYKNKFKGKKIPRPPFWTGFRVEPNLIEFWQDMKFRLHDRLEYKKIKNVWIARKLFP
jgi:pyridoxamine 5'-phosphate oxidase